MKIAAMTTLMLMAGSAAHGEPAAMPAQPKVTVCVEGLTLPGVVWAAPRAQALASQIFAHIGVTIDWHPGFRGCPAQGIQIRVIEDTPASLNPGALAYALPYEGSHIGVFFDRIKGIVDRSRVPLVLGHVLVHEITHILQGVPRHSVSGIMKAHWDHTDYIGMTYEPLHFEACDVELIYLGLSARAARAARTALAMTALDTHAIVAGQ